MRFKDRTDAGRRLAARLAELDLTEPVVLGLPRGGIPVAAEIATALGAPLDVFVARKVGAPGQVELGIGAVAEGSDELTMAESAAKLGLGIDRIDPLAEQARRELARRVEAYRGDRALPELDGSDVVLVDDGLATGVTAEAAVRALRRRRPRRLVLAVPVGSPFATSRLRMVVDDLVCIEERSDLYAVGQWYDDFTQLTDGQVVEILMAHRGGAG